MRLTRLAIVPLAATMACGGATEAAHTVTDSAGVRLVNSLAPAWDGDGGGARTVGDTIVEIGSGAGGDGIQLAGVIAALPRPGGGYVVAEEGGRILFLDAAGRIVRESGGPGEGPGEFRLLAGAGVAGDSVWAYDYSLRRFTWFDPRGQLLGVVPLQTERAALLVVGMLDGGFVMAPSYATGGDGLEPGLRRDTVPYMLVDRSGLVGPTIADLPAREYVVGAEDGRATMATPLFARSASHATAGGMLYHGDRERWEIVALDRGGSKRAIYRRADVSLELSERDLAEEVERRASRHSSSERPGLRRFLLELERPSTRPAYGPFMADAEGTLWVAAYASPGTAPDHWSVLDARGVWLGVVEFPARFRPTWIGGDRVVGVALDAWDVERVVVLALER